MANKQSNLDDTQQVQGQIIKCNHQLAGLHCEGHGFYNSHWVLRKKLDLNRRIWFTFPRLKFLECYEWEMLNDDLGCSIMWLRYFCHDDTNKRASSCSQRKIWLKEIQKNKMYIKVCFLVSRHAQKYCACNLS